MGPCKEIFAWVRPHAKAWAQGGWVSVTWKKLPHNILIWITKSGDVDAT